MIIYLAQNLDFGCTNNIQEKNNTIYDSIKMKIKLGILCKEYQLLW